MGVCIMTGVEVIEFVQKFWLQFVLTSISGFLAWKCKGWYKESKDEKEQKAKEEAEKKAKEEAEEKARQERLKILESAVLAMLHDRLLQSLVYFLKVKEITADEMDNIKLMYAAYAALGGNGTIKILYTRFEKYVRIIPPDYLAD